jgi:hypothetical protein
MLLNRDNFRFIVLLLNIAGFTGSIFLPHTIKKLKIFRKMSRDTFVDMDAHPHSLFRCKIIVPMLSENVEKQFTEIIETKQGEILTFFHSFQTFNFSTTSV